ncbi:ankyrin repeat domain-containing protein [Lamprocystis purpurea]|jgi:ankyrin repeat protein|uniref:ankyrin repeat domain-containing protein n=1 Tax=Lamprocystis purpurea TaxID=61598 RepID=UPI000688339C|nr:ankyrin repeat domain-containing protein [Lamprocystis purpurea]
MSMKETALLEAVVAGDLANAKRWLEAGTPVESKDARGCSLLMIAAGLGQVQMVEMLLAAGADPNVLDPIMGASALHKAAQGGVPEVARLLLEHGAFIDMQSPTLGHTPLHDAVWHKKLEMVKFLLSQGAKTTLKTHGGRDPLYFARRDKLSEIEVAILTEDEHRATLVKAQTLMAAVVANDLDGVKHALATGADVNEVSPMLGGPNDGHTPLLVAARGGYTSIVQELLKAGADPRRVDGLIKATPGHKAGYMGHPEVARLLAEHGLEIDAQGPYNGYTALHDAVWHGNAETVRVFLEAGARTDLRGHDGRTPLDMALQDDYSDCAALLNAHAADGAHDPANELRGFVYQWFAWYDRHAEEGLFLRHLEDKGLEMCFPERTLRSHADFQDWYRGIGKTIRANTHDVSGLRVTPVGKDAFHVDLFVWWRAVTREGTPLSERFRQNWEVTRRNGQFIIQRVAVETQ